MPRRRVEAVRRTVTVVASAAVFGMADQFLGARANVLGFWAVEASLLPVPWLLVAFVAGWGGSELEPE